MRILNLYAGIGGNRKGFKIRPNDVVVAVEWDPFIAAIYQKEFPNDHVIIGDAHQFLLDHFREFDFIWSSCPCPTHSRVRKQLAMKKKKDGTVYEQNKPVFPDMKLYEEIILLDNYYDGIYVVENVIPYYEPLIKPQKLGRHYFWSNVKFDESMKFKPRGSFDSIQGMADYLGYDTSEWHNVNKKLLLRNCCETDISEYIWQTVLKGE